MTKGGLMKLKSAIIASVITSVGSITFADTLTIGLSSEPTAIDPHYHNLSPNLSFGQHIFDPLIKQNENQGLMPGLATSWQPVDENTWELKLREGVTFHDGSLFNADDVIASFERAPDVLNSPSSFATYTKGKEVIRIDDYTVQIKTEAPYPLVPNDISQVLIISDEYADATTSDFNDGSAAIGTGPFRFEEFIPGDRIEIAANADYWDGAPAWDAVTFRPISSGPSRVAALLAGDVDLINGVPTSDIEVLSEEEGISLWQGSSNRVIYLHLDQFRDSSPHISGIDGSEIPNPLLDQRVRLAISKAINRPAIVDRVMEGVAIPAGQLLPEGFFGVSGSLEVEEYDPEGAKALLAEAGYPDGFSITIHGPNDRYINDAKIVEAIAQMLTRVGIQTQVETMPRSVYFKRASSGGADGLPEFSLMLVGWGAGSGEASSPLKSLIHTYDPEQGFGSSNRGRHSNAEIDGIIETALATVNDDARAALLIEATERAIGDLAIIPLHFQVNTWATREGLQYAPRTDEFTLATGVTAAE